MPTQAQRERKLTDTLLGKKPLPKAKPKKLKQPKASKKTVGVQGALPRKPKLAPDPNPGVGSAKKTPKNPQGYKEKFTKHESEVLQRLAASSLEGPGTNAAKRLSKDISRPFYGVTNVAHGVAAGENPKKIPTRLKRGLELKDQKSYVDVLDRAGIKGGPKVFGVKIGDAAKYGVGTVLDFTADPANAIPGGKVLTSQRQARKVAGMITRDSYKAAKKAGQPEKLARKVAKRTYKEASDAAKQTKVYRPGVRVRVPGTPYVVDKRLPMNTRTRMATREAIKKNQPQKVGGRLRGPAHTVRRAGQSLRAEVKHDALPAPTKASSTAKKVQPVTPYQHQTARDAIARAFGDMEHGETHLEKRLSQFGRQLKKEGPRNRLKYKQRKQARTNAAKRVIAELESGKPATPLARDVKGFLDSVGHQKKELGLEGMLDPGNMSRGERTKLAKSLEADVSAARRKQVTRKGRAQGERLVETRLAPKAAARDKTVITTTAKLGEAQAAIKGATGAEKKAARQRLVAAKKVAKEQGKLAILNRKTVTVGPGDLERQAARVTKAQKNLDDATVHLETTKTLKPVLRRGAKEPSIDYLRRVEKAVAESGAPRAAKRVTERLKKAEDEAQGYFPSVTHGQLEAPRNRPAGGARTRAQSTGRRKERRRAEAVAKEQETQNVPLPERRVTDKITEPLRASVRPDLKDIAVARMWPKIHSTGKPYRPKAELADNEATYRLTPQGIREIRTTEAAVRAKRGEDIRILPRELEDFVEERLTPSTNRMASSKGGQKWRAGVGHSKALMTLFNPGTYGKNIVGDTTLMMQSGAGASAYRRGLRGTIAMGAAHAKKPGKAKRLVGDLAGNKKITVVTESGKKTKRSIKQLTTEAQLHDTTGGLVGGEIQGQFGIRNKVVRARSTVETPARLGAYMEARRTMPPAKAAQHTKNYMIDYKDLTTSEKAARDSLLPFVTFTKRNASIQMREAIRRPQVINAIYRTMDERSKDAGYESVEDFFASMDPKEAIRLPIPFAKDVAGSMDIPVSVLLQLFKGGPKDIPKNVKDMTVGLVHPWIKSPVEIAANHSFYYNDKIQRDGLKSPAPAGVNSLPGPLKALFGVEKRQGKDGKWITMWNPKAAHAMRSVPQVAFLLKEGTPRRPNAKQTEAQGRISSATGLRLFKTDANQRERVRLNKLYDTREKAVERQKIIGRQLGGEFGPHSDEFYKLKKSIQDTDREIKRTKIVLGEAEVEKELTPQQEFKRFTQERKFGLDSPENEFADYLLDQGKLPEPKPKPKPKTTVGATPQASRRRLTATTPTSQPPTVSATRLSAPTGPVANTGSPARFDNDLDGAIRKHGHKLDKVAAKYGLDGETLIRKTIWGESRGKKNAVSSAGARAWGQFMPGTRKAVMDKYGLDPWRSPGEAVEALIHHMNGDLGHAKGLEGYNPGGGQGYVDYILKQNVKAAKAAAKTSRLSDPLTVTPQSKKAMNATIELIRSGQHVGGTQLAQAIITDATATAEVPRGAVASNNTSGGLAEQVGKRADKIAGRNQPYLWGGGHVATKEQLRAYKGPLDCSGAVSKVLNINPRVASQFKTWGKPGAGGDITIYAKDDHVLMYVKGRGFFGTSKANPGGGANWIPRSAVSKQYLSSFVARHA